MKGQRGLCLLLDSTRLDWFTNFAHPAGSDYGLQFDKYFQTNKYFIMKNEELDDLEKKGIF